MKINGDHSVLPPVEGKGSGPERGPGKIRRDSRPGDAVEISGRAKVAAHEIGRPDIEKAVGEMKSSLNQLRALLQERTRNGFYDSDEVLGSVAEKILDLFGL